MLSSLTEKGSHTFKVVAGLKLTGRRSVPKSHRFDLSRSLQAKGNVTKRKGHTWFPYN